MNHSFDTSIAKEFGVNEAIFLNNLSFWIEKNRANTKHLYEGRYWTYNSQKALLELFPYWSRQNIRTIINSCIKKGLLIKGNFNKNGYDRTCWYALSDKGLIICGLTSHLGWVQPIENSKLTNSSVGINQPIPYSNTDSDTDTVSESAPLPLKTPADKKIKNHDFTYKDLLDCYSRIFPDNPQPFKGVLSKANKRTIDELVRRWPEISRTQSNITLAEFERYLIALRADAPKFSLGTYATVEGNEKQNGFSVLCRFETVLGFLEGRYS